MRREALAMAGGALLLAGCSKATDEQPPKDRPYSSVRNEAPPIPAPGTGPDARTPLGAPTAKAPTVDPTSTAAAIELVRRFAELLNHRKFGEAYMLMGPNAPPRDEFDGMWGQFDRLSVNVGTPGDQEGAAGSIYLSIPLTLWAIGRGEAVHRSPTVILRRVNDVPGSTEAERHWHIERIDWENPA